MGLLTLERHWAACQKSWDILSWFNNVLCMYAFIFFIMPIKYPLSQNLPFPPFLPCPVIVFKYTLVLGETLSKWCLQCQLQAKSYHIPHFDMSKCSSLDSMYTHPFIHQPIYHPYIHLCGKQRSPEWLRSWIEVNYWHGHNHVGLHGNGKALNDWVSRGMPKLPLGVLMGMSMCKHWQLQLSPPGHLHPKTSYWVQITPPPVLFLTNTLSIRLSMQ